MSILKMRLSNLNENVEFETRSKWTTHVITFLTTVCILSALDLMLAFIRGDSLSNYTMSIVFDLTLSILGLIACSDLIRNNDQDSIYCFLAYMIFLWICITALKLVFLL